MKTRLIGFFSNSFYGVFTTLYDFSKDVVTDIAELFKRVEELEKQPCACSGVSHIKRIERLERQIEFLKEHDKLTDEELQIHYKAIRNANPLTVFLFNEGAD